MLTAYFFAYGRVDAILLGCDGRWAYVDSGYRSDGKKAVEHMKELGVTRLDAYIASHRHRNHVGGAPAIIQAMKPAAIYTRDARMRDRLLALASGSEEKAAVRDAYYRVLAPGDAFWLGPARLECLGPEKLNKYSVGAVGENYNSLILRLEYAARTMLLTGDTSASKLRDIPDEKLRCEVLKNPHHNGALGEKLLKRIAPQIVVVCNGKPPARYYQKRTKAAGAKLYTAGKKGDGRVVLHCVENGPWVYGEPNQTDDEDEG